MKYQSNKKDILVNIDKRKKLALETVGKYVVGEAKLRTPVDLDYLRPRTKHKVKGNIATIGNPVKYAEHVEKGTRFQKAQPFLEPAVSRNTGNIKILIESHFKE